MTELENKLAEKLLEKIDLDKLIEKIGLDVLTDKIAEKAAELIVKKEFTDTPTFPSNPINPVTPWPTPTPYIPPITVMYGVTPTEFNPTAVSKLQEDAATSASTVKEK